MPNGLDGLWNVFSQSLTRSLLINGNLEGKMQSSRGLTKGDLLSSYIFIMYVKFSVENW